MCETIHVPHMSMTNTSLISVALGSLCLIYLSLCPRRAPLLAKAKNKSMSCGCQSTHGGYVYLEEALGTNPCFSNAPTKAY